MVNVSKCRKIIPEFKIHILCNCFLYKFVDFGVFIGHCSKEGKLKCPTCARSVVFNMVNMDVSNGCLILTQSRNILGKLKKAKE